MGWSDCGEDVDGRHIGYGHPAFCDEPECQAIIDRGLSYLCGEMHGDGISCNRYFCGQHLEGSNEGSGQRCRECNEGDMPDLTTPLCHICQTATDRPSKVCEECKWALDHEGFPWPTQALTPAGLFKLAMKVPCWRRCFRVGGPVTLDEANKCAECGQTWKGHPERSDRYQELSRDHA